MVSIKDVAALAGVSDRTVSRVASGDTKLLRPRTRKKVLGHRRTWLCAQPSSTMMPEPAARSCSG